MRSAGGVELGIRHRFAPNSNRSVGKANLERFAVKLACARLLRNPRSRAQPSRSHLKIRRHRARFATRVDALASHPRPSTNDAAIGIVTILKQQRLPARRP